MQKMIIKRTITGSIEDLWAILLNIPELADDIENVHEIEVVSSSENKQTLKWSIWLKGFELEWTEELWADSRRHCLCFQQIEGMLANYSGFWQLSPETPKETVVELHLEIDIGMAYLNKFINPVIANAFKDFGGELLHTLEQKISSAHNNPLVSTSLVHEQRT
jgi:ribosome-associated toxin RatA of RatAB toxin-antitoxin module